jgi:hypothetical protein
MAEELTQDSLLAAVRAGRSVACYLGDHRTGL